MSDDLLTKIHKAFAYYGKQGTQLHHTVDDVIKEWLRSGYND
jgi:hypothetical protein